MDEILVVWELDGLCHLPVGQMEKAVQVARELGWPFHRSSAEGVLLVNCPFTGRQVALIVESVKDGSAPDLGGELQEILTAASVRVNLVRVIGPPSSLPLGGHLLLWLVDSAAHTPLVIVPGRYYGSTRLASLLSEELSSAARLTPGTEVLFLESPRGYLPAGLPAVLIECPPASKDAVKHWAGGLKQGLARHFSGEGTSLWGCAGMGYSEKKDEGREEAVLVFWRRLKELVPQARLTNAAKLVFGLEDGLEPVALQEGPPTDSNKLLISNSSQQNSIKAARAAMMQIQGRANGLSPNPFGRTQSSPLPPAAGYKYPASPYPVSMAPFTRPGAQVQLPEAQPFTRPSAGGVPPAVPDAGKTGLPRTQGQSDCGPGSPLR